MASVAEINKKISDAEFTIKSADDVLKRLRDQLRAYSSAKTLSPSQVDAANKLNERIKAEETKKTEASKVLREYQPKIKDLKKLESLDSQLKTEIDSYNRAVSLGQRPNRSRLNSLYDERQRLAGNLPGLAPKGPILPGAETAITTAVNAPTGPTGVTATSPTDTTGATGAVTPVKQTTAKTPVTPVTPSTSAVTGDKKPKTKEQLYADAINLAVEKYNMPDIIFKNVDSLKNLLNRYINNELTDAQFKREIELDPWYRSNSREIQARYVQLFNYEDLVKQGRAAGTTDYEQRINSITRKIQTQARAMNGIEIPDDQAKLMAKDLYIYNLDNDPSVITERLARFIRPSAGMIGGLPTTGYGGQALQNYQMLQAIAKSNGMKIQDLLPRDATGAPMTAEGTLEQLATGKLDINRIAQDARKLAALGQPDFVKDLLGQGYDLETVYSPYRNSMANILELDPNTISLSDPALRMGIAKNGDMNLYDYERALRNDGRWQYTQQARGEVSDAALRVLRDFGFTG